MTTDECVIYFGSKPKLARALGLQPPSVYEWGVQPPPLRQLQLEALTGGKLVAKAGLMPVHDANSAASTRSV